MEAGRELYALNFFINLLKVFHHFPTFLYKTHSATFTNYKISFMCRVQLMAQLNLDSRKIRCFSLPHGGIYFAASLHREQHPSWGGSFLPSKPKLSKVKRDLTTNWRVLEKPRLWGPNRAGWLRGTFVIHKSTISGKLVNAKLENLNPVQDNLRIWDGEKGVKY